MTADNRHRRLHEGSPWTEYQDHVLRHLYEHQPNEVIADVLGRSRTAVGQRARNLGLRKPEHLLRTGRFQKGAAPWNKGKPHNAGGRSGLYRFQPLDHPSQARNYQPLGSVRVTKDGYLERKISDDRNVVPARRWRGIHRLVWEETNGPIPPGHIVVFKPGMRTTIEAEITIDRLDCITRRENMMRNSSQRFGPEMFQLIQLRGAIQRQIGIREKEERENEQSD